MKLNDESAVRNVLGVDSLEALPDSKILEVAALRPRISDEYWPRLIEQIPRFQEVALRAVDAVEDTFDRAMSANDANQGRLHESWNEIREAIRGRLDRDDISEDHAQFLVGQLMETGRIETDSTETNTSFIAEEAKATRIAAMVQAGLPVVGAVVALGAQLLLNRNIPRI